MSFRKSAVLLSLLSGLSVAAGTAAADELSGELTLTSNYMFRGITQTDKKPAIQGGLEYQMDNGFYAGIWGSSISWLSDSDPDVSSQVEIDGTLGFRGTFGGSEVGYDIGASYYWYPGHYPSGFKNPNTVEAFAGIDYKMFSAKYYYSPTHFYGLEDSRGSSALEGGLDWEFHPGWSLQAQLGKQWVAHHSDENYTYWKIGGTKRFDNGFAIEAAWHDTNMDGVDSAAVLTITKSF